MEQKLTKFFFIVGIAIAFETIIVVLYLYIRELLPLIFLSFVGTYILMLISAKRVSFFDQTNFLQALLYTLLMATPVILLPPILSIVSVSILTKRTPSMDWIAMLKGFSMLFLVKFIYAGIVAFIFCTASVTVIGLSEKKELQVYGTTTQGVICQKWKGRQVWLVRAEYYLNGRKYETRSMIDRSNTLAEKEVVTILYSSQNPYLSIIKDLTERKVVV